MLCKVNINLNIYVCISNECLNELLLQLIVIIKGVFISGDNIKFFIGVYLGIIKFINIYNFLRMDLNFIRFKIWILNILRSVI